MTHRKVIRKFNLIYHKHSITTRKLKVNRSFLDELLNYLCIWNDNFFN